MPLRSVKKAPSAEEAAAIALAALAFLAQDRARLTRFLDVTGLDPAALKLHATRADLQAAVLDHLLDDESALLVFASMADIPAESVAPARDALRASTLRDGQ